jgi:hypothetical protein
MGSPALWARPSAPIPCSRRPLPCRRIMWSTIAPDSAITRPSSVITQEIFPTDVWPLIRAVRAACLDPDDSAGCHRAVPILPAARGFFASAIGRDTVIMDSPSALCFNPYHLDYKGCRQSTTLHGTGELALMGAVSSLRTNRNVIRQESVARPAANSEAAANP